MKAPEDADARIEVELKRGLLQLAVLSMARERTYGYRLCKSLADGGLEVEEGTLYPVLRRLEGQGFLRSLWETSGSRPRKYYEITEKNNVIGRTVPHKLKSYEVPRMWKTLATQYGQQRGDPFPAGIPEDEIR